MISPKLDENIILEGKTVIFKKNDVLKALKVVKGKQLLFEKNKFRCDNIINKEYGQSYKSKLILVYSYITKKSFTPLK